MSRDDVMNEIINILIGIVAFFIMTFYSLDWVLEYRPEPIRAH